MLDTTGGGHAAGERLARVSTGSAGVAAAVTQRRMTSPRSGESGGSQPKGYSGVAHHLIT